MLATHSSFVSGESLRQRTTRSLATDSFMIQTLFGSTEEKPSFLQRMKEAVTWTRESLSERIDVVVAFRKEIDRETLDDLEATLIAADLGTATTSTVLLALREKVDRKQIVNVEELKRVLKDELLAILDTAEKKPVQKVDGEAEVILVVGVNGTGKTTTIGKLAHNLRAQGKTVLLAAADTFRAAAIEQLEVWGDRTGTEVIKNKPGGDPAAVLFDALQAAKARKTDYVIVDRTGCSKRGCSPNRRASPASCSPSWMARPKAASWSPSAKSWACPCATSASARKPATCCRSIRRISWTRYSTDMSKRPTDEQFMQQALELARQGVALASPNPCVGAVVVAESGEIVGRGTHTYEKRKHAEALALEEAGKRARGATLYLNLEPCSHVGRTGPCADAAIAAGVKRVFAAMRDPN